MAIIPLLFNRKAASLHFSGSEGGGGPNDAFDTHVLRCFACLRRQGLVFAGGLLYEGTGIYGKSEVLALDPRTGKAKKRSKILPKSIFGRL